MTSRKIKMVKLSKYCDEYTVVELKALAKTKNITGYSKMKKAELCEALNIQIRPPTTQKEARHETVSSKKPMKQLAPIVLVTSSKKNPVNITAYVKPCDVKNLSFPCTLKQGVFVDKEDWVEYQKLKQKTRSLTRMDRAEYARKANVELEIEKKALKVKKPHTQKVRFS